MYFYEEMDVIVEQISLSESVGKTESDDVIFSEGRKRKKKKRWLIVCRKAEADPFSFWYMAPKIPLLLRNVYNIISIAFLRKNT